MNNKGTYIIIVLAFLLIGFWLGYKTLPKDTDVRYIHQDTLEIIHVTYDTIHKRNEVKVIEYRDRLIHDTLKIVKYKFPEVKSKDDFKGIFQFDNTEFYCSKPFTAVDSVEGKLRVEFHYPEMLFDYDIYSMDSTITKTIFVNKETKLHWTQKEWFIYTTNALSLITGVVIGSQATR